MLAGVDARAKKMLVLTEGVVPYLTVAAVGALADDLRSLDHVRWWIVDYFSPQLLKLLRPKRRQSFRKFAGYALLEPS